LKKSTNSSGECSPGWNGFREAWKNTINSGANIIALPEKFYEFNQFNEFNEFNKYGDSGCDCPSVAKAFTEKFYEFYEFDQFNEFNEFNKYGDSGCDCPSVAKPLTNEL
jgi:hypothetical protein